MLWVLRSLAKLKTLRAGGLMTAGSASQVTDGASAVLIMNEAGTHVRMHASRGVGREPVPAEPSRDRTEQAEQSRADSVRAREGKE